MIRLAVDGAQVGDFGVHRGEFVVVRIGRVVYAISSPMMGGFSKWNVLGDNEISNLIVPNGTPGYTISA